MRARLLLFVVFFPYFCFSSLAQLARLSTTRVGETASVEPVTVTLAAGGSIDQVKVVSAGKEGLDFRSAGDTCKASSFLAPGQSCVVEVTFTPLAPGERRGAIVLFDKDGQVLGSRALTATATGAIATFVPGRITTVAGNYSTFLFAGDNGPATKAAIFLPFGVVVDAAGDLYIADTYNNRIRKVDGSTGIIRTVAGNGTSDSSANSGSALAVGLSNPSSIVLDGIGNLYIADTGNNVVRKVDLSGNIFTFAGTVGQGGYGGDAGPATQARLQSPNGLAFDNAGNLYIADTGNNRIRSVNPSGIISTVAGNGTAAYTGNGGPATSASLQGPWGVAVSNAGELYIADQKNNVVRRVDASGVITTIAGTGRAGSAGDDGPASKSQLNAPASVAMDAVGNLYISDSSNNRIRKINPNTNIITTIAGTNNSGTTGDNGPANAAGLSGPFTIALDGLGNLFIADSFHNRIRKVLSNASDLLYSAMRVNSISAPMDQLIENDGNAALNFSSLLAGANAQLDGTTTCSTAAPLSPLAQCSIAADYAPTVVGSSATGSPANGVITVASNALNASNTILLRGTVASTYPSTVLLSSGPNPSIVGDPVQFLVQVLNQGVTPTGSVTLLDGTSSLATMKLLNGVATFTISTLAVGQHAITAAYAGDVNYGSATSLPVIQVVQVLPPNSGTTTSLTSSANPVDAGQALTLTAKVSASTAGQTVPSGTVTFQEGTTVLGTGTLSEGAASISISNLTVGTHLLTATYGGSGTYASSTSSVLTQIVGSAGQPTQFTFTVTPTTLSLKSGAHASFEISITTAGGFADTLSFGCAGLPSAATCTFSQDQLALTGGLTKTLSVVLDTGNPLGAGPAAQMDPVHPGRQTGVLACVLPAGVLLAFSLGGSKRRRAGILLSAMLLGIFAMLSGCGSSYKVHPTPAGNYQFQIFATGSMSGATYETPVRLTVTK